MMIPFMVRQAHHERNQQLAVRPEPVEGLMQKTPQAGFTLLEILVAMAVFAIMAGMAYAGLHTVLETRNSTEVRAESLAQWQRFVYTLNDDLAQAIPRGVRDEFGSEQIAFIGGNDATLLTLTRSVADWSGQSARSNLQRVEYRQEADGLYRLVWNVLDRTQQSQLRRRKLLTAEKIDLRFYGSEWGSVWPASGGGLPKAVEARVQLVNLGDLRRVFTVRQ
jgi:general secretion pathway protein J